MNFTFLCLLIQCLFASNAYAKYNKDVICVLDKDQQLICKTLPRLSRRDVADKSNNLPSHDPYIPRTNAVLYNCSLDECRPVILRSITELTSPETELKTCYNELNSDDYTCESIKYQNFKNVDKLLFLTNNIRSKAYYLVDCLVYVDGGRVCHKKDNVESHAQLLDTGTMARPKEPSVLSQDEFICEEGEDKQVNCDSNSYVPFDDGLKKKQSVKNNGDVLLKRGAYVVILKHTCLETWCGYSGRIMPSRRSPMYEPPGGKVYRCYYAKKQQICKELYDSYKHSVYYAGGWVKE